MLAKFGVGGRNTEHRRTDGGHSYSPPFCNANGGGQKGKTSQRFYSRVQILFLTLYVPKNMLAKFGVDWCNGVSDIAETKV